MDDFHEVSRAAGPQKTGDAYTCAENRIGLLLGSISRELAVSKVSVQLQNGADELDALGAPSSRQGCDPARIDSAIVAGSDSRSGVGA